MSFAVVIAIFSGCLLHFSTVQSLPTCCSHISAHENKNLLKCNSCSLNFETDLNSELNLSTLVASELRASGSAGNSWNLAPQNFSKLSALRTLTIKNSNITSIKADTFKGLKELRKIHLSDNEIRFIGPRAFEGLHLLQLNLENNPDISITPDAFKGARIDELVLSNCNLKSINPDVIFQAQIKYLDLSDNKISRLTPEFERVLQSFDTMINLSANPLDCTCDMFWLSERLRLYQEKMSGTSKINDFVCASPSSLSHQRLPLKRFLMCLPPQITKIDVKLLEDASNAELTCFAEGQESPHIDWLLPEGKSISDRTLTPRITSLANSKTFESYRSVKIPLSSTSSNRYKCQASSPDGYSDSEIELNLSAAEIIPVILSSNKTTTTLKPTLILEQREKANNLFVKQFTLLELIGAIIATFVCTVLMLYLCSRCVIPNLSRRKSTRCMKRSLNFNGDKVAHEEATGSDSLLINSPDSSTMTANQQAFNQLTKTLPMPRLSTNNVPLPPIPGIQTPNSFFNGPPSQPLPEYVYNNILGGGEYDLPRYYGQEYSTNTNGTNIATANQNRLLVSANPRFASNQNNLMSQATTEDFNTYLSYLQNPQAAAYLAALSLAQVPNSSLFNGRPPQLLEMKDSGQERENR